MEYRKKARRMVTFYALLVVALAFVGSALSVDPAGNCAGDECAPALVWVAGIVGGVFAAAALYALIADTEWGSRLEGDVLVWWVGRPGAPTKTLALQAVRRIRISASSNDDRITFYDARGKALFVPTECIPPPLSAWADAIAARFTHIQVERDI